MKEIRWSQAEILRRLRRTARRWYVDLDDSLRLRGGAADGRDCCPITALPRRKADRLGAYRVIRVAEQLGIPDALVSEVMAAADWRWAVGELNGRHARLRRKLLAACGCAEEEADAGEVRR